MTKLYVAGPMSGIVDHNFPAFDAATEALRSAGYEVVSPHELDDEIGTDQPWEVYLKRDLKHVVDADGIATLPGWEDSRGARLEVEVAKALSIPVAPAYHWLDGNGVVGSDHDFSPGPKFREAGGVTRIIGLCGS